MGFVIAFQILDPMVDHLDLLLNNRHSLCEVVVFSDFSGQVLHLGLHDSLSLVVGNQDTEQRNDTRDDGGNDSIIHFLHPQ